jgi:hypothetical protein
LESTQTDKLKNIELKEFKRQRVLSIVLFIVFIFGCILNISGNTKTGYNGFGTFVLYVVPYFIYLVVSLIVVYFCYRKILVLSIIALLVIGLLASLNATGFCYKTMSFVSPNKATIIDKAIALYVEDRCNHEKYIIKNMGLEEKECSVSFNSIKEEAPHCFTKDRPDKCVGDITYLDFESGDIVKKEMVIYEMYETCSELSGRWKNCNFFDYALDGKIYDISGALDIGYMGIPYVWTSCGKKVRF